MFRAGAAGAVVFEWDYATDVRSGAALTHSLQAVTGGRLTTTVIEHTSGKVHVIAADPVGLVRRLKQEAGAGVWLAGGGRLAGALLEEIDVLVLKRYPILLGTGIPLIATDKPTVQAFTITDERALAGGTTVTTYARTS